MKFSIDAKVKKDFLNSKKIIEKQNLKAANILITMAREIQKEARKSIADKSDGFKSIRYTASGKKKTHWTSFPGDPPNLDTGRLNNSIQVQPDKATSSVKTVLVGTNLKYGLYLEFGMYGSRNARPWLAPAYKKVFERRREILEKFEAI